MIAIDPGYSARGDGNACARFIGGELRAVWFARSIDGVPCKHAWLIGPSPVEIVGEKPQADARLRNASPTTLIDLAWEGALLVGIYAGASGAAIVSYTPTQWKGDIAKPVHHRALWRALTPAERIVLGGKATCLEIDAAAERHALKRRVTYKSTWLTHNLLDAAALGCYHLGRIKGGSKR